MELGIGSIAFIYTAIKKKQFSNSIDLLLHSIEDTLIFTEKNGLRVCEIILDPPEILLSERKREIIDICRNFPSIKKQFHAPYSDLSLCTHNPWIVQATIDCYDQSAKFCKQINAQVLTIHPGDAKFLHHYYNGIKNRLIDSVNILSERIKMHNPALITCLENMPKMAGLFLEYKEITNFFSEVKCNDIYFTWDIGHSWSCDDNIERLWGEINKKIKNIHLVDSLGENSDIHPALGEGNVNFKQVFELTENYDYDGSMIIELHKHEDLPKSIDYVKKFF
ncbi:MAG: sugar phosphate isomerase/epimerase family protein [Promethearchaeota archaeon]